MLILCAPVLVVLDVVTAVLVLRAKAGDQLDLEVYRLGALAWSTGQDLYGQLPATPQGWRLPFIYPPIAAILYRPAAALSSDAAQLVNALAAVVLLVVVVVLAARRLPPAAQDALARFGGWPVLAGIATPIALFLEPVQETLFFGQINIVLMAMVAIDCLVTSRRWPRGVLIGLAAAIKLTPLAFLLFFLLRRDFRAIVVSVVSFCAFTVIGFVGAPKDSVTYWTEALFRTTKVVGTSYGTNQSLYGMFARFGGDKHLQTALWLLACAVVLVLTAVAMRWLLATGQVVAAMVVNGVAGLLLSPISWSHHWVWVVPALVLVLGASSWRLWLAALPVGVVFMIGPHWLVPLGRERELRWTLGEQLVGNAYVLTAVVVLGVLCWLALRSRSRERDRPDEAAASLAPVA